jgi:hypothetical protein
MSTLDHNEPEGEKILGSHGPKPEEVDASAGYEQSDVGVTGIVVFLTSLLIFVAVCGLLTYGMGKLINARMNKEDGPNSKWTTAVNIRDLGNLPNNPEMQHKVAELTQQFPTPRVQTDDGNQDVADLHQREDLLLDNYSWVDPMQGAQGKVRIPIERAMELIAQRGLPVAPATATEAPLMAGDSQPVVQVPLTSGFARTGYEQDQATARAEEKGKGTRE